MNDGNNFYEAPAGSIDALVITRFWNLDLSAFLIVTLQIIQRKPLALQKFDIVLGRPFCLKACLQNLVDKDFSRQPFQVTLNQGDLADVKPVMLVKRFTRRIDANKAMIQQGRTADVTGWNQ